MEKNLKNFITTVINTVDMDKETRKALLLNNSWMSSKSLTDCLRRILRNIWQMLLITLLITLEIITISRIFGYHRYSKQDCH